MSKNILLSPHLKSGEAASPPVPTPKVHSTPAATAHATPATVAHVTPAAATDAASAAATHASPAVGTHAAPGGGGGGFPGISLAPVRKRPVIATLHSHGTHGAVCLGPHTAHGAV